jgi:hypothetical protein
MADKTTEERISELETLVWNIPIAQCRFTRFNTEFAALRAAIADNTARLASLERTMTALQTDMRDLREGVIRQLIEQDRRLVTMADKLAEILHRLPKPNGP